MGSYFDDVVKFHREGGYRYDGPPRKLPGWVGPEIQKNLIAALHCFVDGIGGTGEQGLRVRLILEELEEYLEAVRVDDLVAQFDALIDLTYVVIGAADHHGFAFDLGWDAVQQANMAKVDGPDLPTFREDGKMLKPEGWVGPEDLLHRIMQNGSPTSDLPGEVIEAEVLSADESEAVVEDQNGRNEAEVEPGGGLYGKW